jgi:thiosulfate/3-mercaptopyruvate sulfurtransferase
MDYAHPELVVEPAWLAAHLSDPDLRIVEVGDDAVAYEGGHIPGAVFWDVYATLLRPDLRTEDDPTVAAALFGQAGITPATRVILYGRHAAMAAWGLWYLRLFNHQAAAVLNAVAAGWQAAGYPLSREPATPAPTNYPPQAPDPAVRADLAAVRAAVGQPGTTLVDVRSPHEYRGSWFVTGPPGDGERGGHIPGAVPIVFRETVTSDGTFHPAEELQAVYTSRGVTPDQNIILYCMVGMRAAYTWFVLNQLLGYPRVRPYDLSWNEWGRLPDTPVEEGAAPT